MEIPRTINDPTQFLFWSLDEIYPVAVGLIWGIWFDQLLLGMFLGWMAIRIYRRFRDRNHFSVLVGTARNITERPITFREQNCQGSHTAAVAMWPKNTLHPGQRRELFILLNTPDQTSIPVVRPSLLTY